MSAAGIIPFCDCIQVIRALKRRARTHKKARIDFYGRCSVSSNAIDFYGSHCSDSVVIAIIIVFPFSCQRVGRWKSIGTFQKRAQQQQTISTIGRSSFIVCLTKALIWPTPYTQTHVPPSRISPSKLIKRRLIHAIKYKACPAFRKIDVYVCIGARIRNKIKRFSIGIAGKFEI